MALTGLAVVQPVLDVLGRSPETFVFRGVDHTHLVLFALLVALVPGLVLWALGALTRLAGETVRTWVHVGMVGGLAGLAVLVGLRQADLARGGLVLAVAVGAGVLAAFLYVRVTQV